ncbi:biotin transporter BioY [Haloarcula pelagica]|uniref:biotin transporter BioY n=1 Tax=Haloarcula pelagica TaxID=3033389 RepID=UPI0024C39993|nr:biotin transporter BioY [Halomicroarcula sp. YJ-61-S]
MSQEHDSVELVGDETVRHISLAAVLAALTAAFAYVSIPIPGLPAPVSFQVFGVYFAGLLLGPRWGGFSIALYLLVGIAGAPVFSNGGAGLGYVLGPTGGYLIGFLVAAVLIGAIVHRTLGGIADRGSGLRPLSEVSVAVQAGALVAGLVVIYAVGVPWLATMAGLPLVEAATVGAAVFLPGDAIKIAATLALVRAGALARQQAV